MCGVTLQGGQGAAPSPAQQIVSPGATSRNVDAAVDRRRGLQGFAANLLTDEEGRKKGSIARKLVLGS